MSTNFFEYDDERRSYKPCCFFCTPQPKPEKDATGYLNKRASKRFLIREKLKHLFLNPCVKCGFQDVRALDFHHIDPSTKSEDMSKLIRYGSIKRFKEEITKCQVLCANCHRIHTAGEQKWAIHQLYEELMRELPVSEHETTESLLEESDLEWVE